MGIGAARLSRIGYMGPKRTRIRDETINVHVRDGEKIYRCEVTIKLAKLLAPYFLSGKDPTVRIWRLVPR